MWRGEASPSSENGCNQYVHSTVWQLLFDWGNINIEQTQLRDGCTDPGDLISGHGLTETSHVALASPSKVLTSKPQLSESEKNKKTKHTNWISKMKKEFPDWIFVDPKASGTTDVMVVDKADKVYFFTDTISHSTYYKYLNVIRDRKINFGYIHGVNVEKNISDIYRDMHI